MNTAFNLYERRNGIDNDFFWEGANGNARRSYAWTRARSLDL